VDGNGMHKDLDREVLEEPGSPVMPDFDERFFSSFLNPPISKEERFSPVLFTDQVPTGKRGTPFVSPQTSESKPSGRKRPRLGTPEI
jgi:hypothetical protein